MKQYWLFIITALQDIIFGAIDSTFANNVNLDVIVVINSFLIVMYFCLRPMQLGFYAYQAMQSRPKNCLVCSVIAGSIVGLIVIIFSDIMPYMFTLESQQREALAEVFRLFGICAPLQAVTRYLQSYCAYIGKQRLVLISAFVTYIPMIIGDWIAVSLNAGAFGLRLSTELCWVLYFIVLLPASGILKTHDKVERKMVLHCFYVGKDVCISQSIIRGATLFLTSTASTMGTVSYALHSVALGITDMAECFRDATVDYSILELREHRDNLAEYSRVVIKKLFAPALVLPLGLECILVIVMHGKVGIMDAAITTAIYSLPFLVYSIYDISAASIRLSTVRSSAITMSLITVAWRVGVLWVLVQIFGAVIPVFGIIYFLDYLSRTIFYRIMLHKEERVLVE